MKRKKRMKNWLKSEITWILVMIKIISSAKRLSPMEFKKSQS